MDYQLACVLPSKLALAGLTFAHAVHNGQKDAESKMWRAQIENHFQCQLAQIYAVVRQLANLVLADVANERKSNKLRAVRNKYASINCLLAETNAKVKWIKNMANEDGLI